MDGFDIVDREKMPESLSIRPVEYQAGALISAPLTGKIMQH
jgi:hypothetical protein